MTVSRAAVPPPPGLQPPGLQPPGLAPPGQELPGQELPGQQLPGPQQRVPARHGTQQPGHRQPSEIPEGAARSLVALFRRRRWILVAAVVPTVLLSVLMASMHDDVHRAEALVAVRVSVVDDLLRLERGPGDTQVAEPGNTLENEVTFLESDLVRSQVAIQLGSDEVPVARGIASDSDDTFVVQVDAATSELAQLVANTYADAYVATRTAQAARRFGDAGVRVQRWIDEIDAELAPADASAGATPVSADRRAMLESERVELERLLDRILAAEALDLPPADVLRDADSTTTARRLGMGSMLVAATGAGLALGIIAAVLIDLLDDLIRTPADLARARRGAPLFAVVPVDPSEWSTTPTLRRSVDPASSAYRALRNHVLICAETPVVVMVTSLEAGDGATTVAANLAVVLAETGRSVVIVDTDLRSPTLHELFGVDGSMGLVEVLAGEDLDLALLPLDDRLHLLAAGSRPPDPSPMLSSPAFGRLVAALGERFSYIVLDTPPLAVSDDLVHIAPYAHLRTAVISAQNTSARRFRDSLARLGRLNVTIDGFVLNRAELRRSIGRRHLGRRGR